MKERKRSVRGGKVSKEGRMASMREERTFEGRRVVQVSVRAHWEEAAAAAAAAATMDEALLTPTAGSLYNVCFFRGFMPASNPALGATSAE